MVSAALLTTVHSNASLTPQQVADYEHHLKEQRQSTFISFLISLPSFLYSINLLKRSFREKLTLLRSPCTTCSLFLIAILSFLLHTAHYIATHWIFLFLLLPLSLLWYIQEQFSGPYTHIINQIERGVEFIIWWVGLGILSSIGLGSGLQSSVRPCSFTSQSLYSYYLYTILYVFENRCFSCFRM